MAIFLTNRDGGKTDEEGHYRYLSAGFTGNVLDGFNVTQNTPLGMSIAVNPGNAKVPYGGYSYSTWIAPSDKEVATIPTASASNPRIDRIVLYVDRTTAPQTTTPNNPGIPKIAVVSGTPGAVPVRPSNTAVNTAVSNNPWIDLADVRVNTGVTQITNANITDTRIMASAVLAKDAVTPDKRSGGFFVSLHTFANSTGTQTITGIGFKPKAILVTGDAISTVDAIFNQGYCYYTGSGYVQGGHSSYVAAAGPTRNSQSSSTQAFFANTASAIFRATVTGFGEGTITVDVTNTNSQDVWRRFHIMAFA